MNTVRFHPSKVAGIAALATVFFGAGAPLLHAQTNSHDQVDLPPGTIIPVKLNTELSSRRGHLYCIDDSGQAYPEDGAGVLFSSDLS